MERIQLDEIPEGAASGRIAEIYEDIRQTLRTTQVSFLYRALAVHEAYFAAAWEALRPNASISYFERCADGLRMRMVPPMPEDVPDLEEELEALGYAEEQVAEIAGVLDAYDYANPKNLILAAALKGALNGLRVGGVKPGFEEDLRPLPRGAPTSMVTPRLVDAGEARGKLSEVYDRIREESQTEGLGSVWRALGHYPEFLERAWSFVSEEQKKPGFEITVSLSQGAAAAAAQEFPHPVDLARNKARELGSNETELELIDQKLDCFIHLIPRTNSSIQLMKAALVGEGKVRRKPFERE